MGWEIKAIESKYYLFHCNKLTLCDEYYKCHICEEKIPNYIKTQLILLSPYEDWVSYFNEDREYVENSQRR